MARVFRMHSTRVVRSPGDREEVGSQLPPRALVTVLDTERVHCGGESRLRREHVRQVRGEISDTVLTAEGPPVVGCDTETAAVQHTRSRADSLHEAPRARTTSKNRAPFTRAAPNSAVGLRPAVGIYQLASSTCACFNANHSRTRWQKERSGGRDGRGSRPEYS